MKTVGPLQIGRVVFSAYAHTLAIRFMFGECSGLLSRVAGLCNIGRAEVNCRYLLRMWSPEASMV